mgnify:CR=1 FL=1
MNNIDEMLEQSVLRIYEGLSRKVIKEGVTIDELNDKINTILDALGLADEDTKVEVEKKEEEPAVEEETEEEVVTEEEEPKVEETEDTFTVDEGLEQTTGNYVVKFSRNAEYKDWFTDTIKSKLNSESEMEFNTLDELITFLNSGLVPTTYANIEKLEENAKAGKDALLTTMNYRVYVKGVQ